MAQIINYNPQDNPRLQQIYQILLLAGYFRIRIASLKAFDKITGGIAWCITSSNFQIEIDYNDQMQVGQKIKVSEHICYALKNMQCPYTLQPFQLQGLDVNNIFPVVQWLVKFVYQTRWQRQKYNRQISVLEGNKILNLDMSGSKSLIKSPQIKRNKINKAIMQTGHSNPIRVYSALLQFNDMTSLKMYNKLHNMMLNKNQKKKKAYNTQQEQIAADQDFFQILNPNKQKAQNQNQASEQQAKVNMNHFSNLAGKINLEKLQKIIQENKQKYQNALKEQHHDQEENQQGQSNNQNTILKNIKNLHVGYEDQIKVLQSQLQSLRSIMEKNQRQKEQITEKRNQVKEKLQKRLAKLNEIKQYGQEIQTELNQKKKNLNKNLQKLVEKKIKLKQKKAEIKKKAKADIEQLQEKRTIVEASIPQIDEQAFKQMMKQAELKKQIFDKKYQELTLVNQQLAILQRKAQNYTSAPQIAQYHQRFVQLFQAINCLIQEKRTIYSQMQNLESIQKVVDNYKDFLANAKDGIMNARKKNEKKDLIEDLKDILSGFQKNMVNSQNSLEKLEKSRDSSYEQYSNLIKLEREYIKCLRNLKVEYENAQKFYK